MQAFNISHLNKIQIVDLSGKNNPFIKALYKSDKDMHGLDGEYFITLYHQFLLLHVCYLV